MVSDGTGPPSLDQNFLRVIERLRRGNRILKEERELLKKATQFFAVLKP
jgi:transposase